MYFNPLSPTRWTQHPNATILRGGGGGGSSSSGVPEWLRPQVQDAATGWCA